MVIRSKHFLLSGSWIYFNLYDYYTAQKLAVFNKGNDIKDKKDLNQGFPNSTLHCNQAVRCFNLVKDLKVR